MNKPSKNKLTKQVGKFGIVGISNTVIDLGIFNVLNQVFSVYVVYANIVSVSLAIINSYIWNKKWTFRDESKDDLPQEFTKFVAFSLIGLGIQTFIVWVLADKWTVSGEFVYDIIKALSLDGIFSFDFVINNWAKVWGIALALSWNFIAYKKIVFKEKR